MFSSINCGGRLLDLREPKVMGILNITPDSFFSGSRTEDLDATLKRAAKLIEEGADILDIGAYSTRPGAAEVMEQEELSRLIPVIKELRLQFPDAILSIDTFRARVAAESVAAGAHIINDISGGELDGAMLNTIADLHVPYILMHMRGTPQNKEEHTNYGNVDLIHELSSYFGKKIAWLRSKGVADIILDPGFGFAKTLEQNYELLSRLDELNFLALPILGGISRKTMIYKALGINAEEALNGTTVLNTLLLQKGVRILRVHDVRAAREAIALCKLAKVIPPSSSLFETT